MPAVPRLDFGTFRKESRMDRHRGTKNRGSFIWPYINQQDLADTKSFPLLLNARGRYPPSHFAAADNRSIRLGFVSAAIVPIFLNEHVMVLNVVIGNSREYGRLMSWDDHPDAFDWIITRKQFLPGEGLIILEAQERLLDFLVQCSLDLLHDIPKETVTSDAFPILDEPRLKAESDISGFDSLHVMAAEAPYRVPAKLDLSRVESLFTARASAAEDHLWALREDPEYFSRIILEAKDHRQEILKDLAGNSHPVFRRGQQDIIWSRIISRVVGKAYLEVEMFSELSMQASGLVQLQKQYADQIIPSKDLPKHYQRELLRFRYYVNQTAKGPLEDLKLTAVASPPLRKFFSREPPSDPSSSKILTISKPGVKMDKLEQHLLWLLRTLWEDGKDLFFASMNVVVDELERLLQSEPRARELLSPYVSTLVGDLFILSQTLNQLEMYQPWAQAWENAQVDYEEELEDDWAQRSKPWSQILGALQERGISMRATKLVDPAGGRFTYPVHKRHSKENVEALRRAEGNLDAFWAAIDQLMTAEACALRDTAVHTLLTQTRILQRTREWVEPEKPPSTTLTRDKKTEAHDWAFYLPISSTYSEASAKSWTPTQPKPKIKTRGKVGCSQEGATEAEVPQKPDS